MYVVGIVPQGIVGACDSSTNRSGRVGLMKEPRPPAPESPHPAAVVIHLMQPGKLTFIHVLLGA